MELHGAELTAQIEPLFRENFEHRGELGAALSIWHGERPIVELHGGFRDAHRTQPWTDETIVLVWSATKGLGAACLLHVLEQEKIALSRCVSEFWPEFAQAGKSEVTFAQLLSHSAGLCALDQPVDVLDYEAVVRALARQKPLWPPGEGHGYHARTFGFLLDELVRRIAQVDLPTYWRNTFAEPLQLDLWIGLPASENHRVANIYAAKIGQAPAPAQFYADLTTPGTLVRKTFTSPAGLHSVSAMNKPEQRARAIVSFSGIGSARALAKFYALLANGGELGGRRFFAPQTIALMTTTLSDGIDRVFQIPTAFSAGFMQNAHTAQRLIFGPSTGSFGHPGAGGSHAFADPVHNVSFAYTMNQMEQSLLPNEKSLRIVDMLYEYVARNVRL